MKLIGMLPRKLTFSKTDEERRERAKKAPMILFVCGYDMSTDACQIGFLWGKCNPEDWEPYTMLYRKQFILKWRIYFKGHVWIAR